MDKDIELQHFRDISRVMFENAMHPISERWVGRNIEAPKRKNPVTPRTETPTKKRTLEKKEPVKWISCRHSCNDDIPSCEEIETRVTREIALEIVSENGMALFDLPVHFHLDREIVMCALTNAPLVYGGLPNILMKDKDIAICAASGWGGNLAYMAWELKDDIEVVRAAVTQKHQALRYASDRLKEKKEIVLIALKECIHTLTYAGKTLLDEFEIIQAALMHSGLNLKNFSEQVKKDPGLVYFAVKMDGRALEFAAPELQDNYETVLAAVQQTGRAYQFASQSLKGSREIVMAAVSSFGEALRHAPEEAKRDYEIVRLAIENDGKAIWWSGFYGHKPLGLLAVRQNGWAITKLTSDLFTDREIILEAVSENGGVLRFLLTLKAEFGCEFDNDEEIVTAAVKNCATVYQFASRRLRDHKDLAMIAVERDAGMFLMVSERLSDDLELQLLHKRRLGFWCILERRSSFKDLAVQFK
jgi:hypothetical protein